MRVGELVVHRELQVPDGGGEMTERWTLGIEGEVPAIAPRDTCAALDLPPGMPPGQATAMLLARAVELVLTASSGRPGPG